MTANRVANMPIAFRSIALSLVAVLASACASQPPPQPVQISVVTPPAIVIQAPPTIEQQKPAPRPARVLVPVPVPTTVQEPPKHSQVTRTVERPVAVPPAAPEQAKRPVEPTKPERQASNQTTETPIDTPPADAEKAKRFALKEAAVIATVIAASRAAYLSMGKPCACPDNVMRNGQACGQRSAHSKPGGYKPLCYPTDVGASIIATWRATGAIPQL
jgi:outer membrane biosynthesis protein TonB